MRWSFCWYFRPSLPPSGDPFTLMVVFLPLYLLYELGILIVRE